MPLPTPLIRKIKTLSGKLGLDDDTYRAMLSGYGVSSCTKLSVDKAKNLIDRLEGQAISAGVWEKPKPRPKKFAEYEYRPAPMATGRQLRMLDAMWKGVSRIPDEGKRGKALDSFCKRIVGVDQLVWIEHKHVAKLTRAIKAMAAKKKGGKRGRQKKHSTGS